MVTKNKNIKSNYKCPFCAKEIDQLGHSIYKCLDCKANYHLATNPKIPTTIMSFDTKNYSVQIYKTDIGFLTRVNIKNKREALFWIKEDLNIEKYTLSKLNSRITKLIALS